MDRRLAPHRPPAVERPVGLIFAADHGVAAAEAVSAYPTDVTAAMFAAYQQGRSTISAFARHAGAAVDAVDVGIGRPTADIRFEAALTTERFDEIVEVAVAAVDRLDGDLLVVGEMGIGNTTPSAAIAAALAGGETAAWVGRGTGVDDAGLARKRAAVQQAVRRIAGVTDPIEVLREVGGAELVAIAAAVVAARHRSLPVVLDGYVVTSSVLPLVMVEPAALDHCIVGHCSAEPGHRRLLERLGKRPLLDLDMRLGEGSGAMAAVPARGHGLRRHHRGPDVRRVVQGRGAAARPIEPVAVISDGGSSTESPADADLYRAGTWGSSRARRTRSPSASRCRPTGCRRAS